MTDQRDHHSSAGTRGDGSSGHEDVPGSSDEAVMGLLHDHVPLTLLVDLVDAPPSEQVLVEEGIPEQRWWEGSEESVGAPPEESGED